MTRTLNARFLLIFVLSLAVVSGGIYGLHEYQVRRHPDTLLARARDTEARGDWRSALLLYLRYTNLFPSDGDAYADFVLLAKKHLTQAKDRRGLYLALEQALQKAPKKREDEVRSALAESAMELGRYGDACSHLTLLLERRVAVRAVDVYTAITRGSAAHTVGLGIAPWLIDLAGTCLPARVRYPDELQLRRRLAESESEGGGRKFMEEAEAMAAKQYETIVAMDPTDVDSAIALARLYHRLPKQKEHANQCIERMLTHNDRSTAAYLSAAEYYREVGLTEKAAETVRSAYAILPNDAEVLLAMADILQTGADIDHGREEARTHLQHGATLDPKDARFLFALAQLELVSGRPEEAAAALHKAFPLVHQEAEAVWTIAELLLDADKPTLTAEAKGLVSRLRARVPISARGIPASPRIGAAAADDPAVTGYRGKKWQHSIAPAALDYLDARIHFSEGEWLKAAELFTALKKKLNSVAQLTKRLNYFLGKCWENLGNPDLALAAYTEALAEDKKWAPARLGVAAAYLSLGNLDKALSEYHQVATVEEGRLAEVRLLILRNLRASAANRDWPAVEEKLQALDRSLLHSFDVALLRAEVLVGQERLEDARKYLEAAPILDTVAQSVATWSFAAGAQSWGPVAGGEVRYLAGVAEWALTTRRGLPESFRGHSEYWIARAALAERMRQPDLVLPLLDEGERHLGKHVDLHLARARHWAQQAGGPLAPRDLHSRAVQALAAIENDLPLFSAIPGQQTYLRVGLGEALYQLGELQQAERLWKQVVEAEPRRHLYVWMLLFDLAQERKDFAALEEIIKQFRAIEGEAGALWHYAEAARLVMLAEQGDRSGLRQATKLLMEAERVREQWSRVPVLRARIAELEERYDDMMSEYRAAMRLGERRPAIVRRVVQLLYERRRYDEADTEITKLIEQAPLTGDLGKLAAETALNKPDTQKALERAKVAVDSNSRDFQDHLWLGNIYAALRHRKEADQAYGEAIRLAPQQPSPYVAFIRFLAKTGRADQAEEVLAQARSQLPPDKRALAVVEALQALGRNPDAEKEYLAALKAWPDDPSLLRSVSDFYLSHGAPTLAAPYLRRLLTPDVKADKEDRAWGRRSLAFVLALTHEEASVEEALRLLDQNRQGDTLPVEDQLARGILLALQPARIDEAITILEPLAKRTLLTPDQEYILAKAYELEGRWGKARTRLSELAHETTSETIPPDRLEMAAYYIGALVRHDDPIGRENLTFAARKLEQLEKSIGVPPDVLVELRCLVWRKSGKAADAKRAVEEYRKTKDARQGLVAALFEDLGKPAAAEAESAYRSLLTNAPPADKVLVAAYFGRCGNVEDALALCESLPGEELESALDTEVGIVISGKANEQQIGRVDARLTEVVEKRPSVPLLLSLARLRDHQRRYGDAIALYRRALETDGRNTTALNNLAWLLALSEQKYDQALDLSNRAIRIGGPVSGNLDTRAVIHILMRKPDKAMEDITQAINQHPTAATYFHKAQAEDLDQSPVPAARNWQRAEAAAEGLGLQQALHPLEHDAFVKLQEKYAKKK
jgi:tetratricopeptide (TPR) repeat protein